MHSVPHGLHVVAKALRLPGGWVLELSVLYEAREPHSGDSLRQLAWGLALRRRSLWPQLQSGTGSAPDSARSGNGTVPKSGGTELRLPIVRRA